ncbi:MAG: suppressor of fused domain protein [Geodermatophilaceae bacterium]|nr:suppressor of fused domain protein [Geodermatophilaceae bacterium]
MPPDAEPPGAEQPSGAVLLAAVEAAWVTAFGPVGSRGSVSFVGVAPIDVLRIGPDSAGAVRYVTLGMARMPMSDPRAVVMDPVAGPRAELVLTLSRRRDSILRAMAALASAPAVDGLVLAPDATVDTGLPLWDGAEFTAVLVNTPTLPDVVVAGGGEPIRLLPVVPITGAELAYRRIHGAEALREVWREAGTDLHAPTRRTTAIPPA